MALGAMRFMAELEGISYDMPESERARMKNRGPHRAWRIFSWIRMTMTTTTTTKPDYDRRPRPEHVTLDSEPILDAGQLKAEVERLVGPVRQVVIHPPGDDDPTTARFEAISAAGSTIRGIVTMRTAWLDGAMVVEPVVEVAGVFPGSGTIAAADLPRQLLRRRLDQVVVRLQRLVTEVRVRPDIPAHELAAELQRVVELAEIEG